MSAPSVAASSLTPRSSTGWLSIGMPGSRMRADVAERGAELFSRKRRTSVRADHLAAETEAAVDRTHMYELQQHAIGIAVHDALDRAVGIVADRIGALLRRDRELRRIGNE